MLTSSVAASLAYAFLPHGSARPIESPLSTDAAFQVPQARRAAFIDRLGALSTAAELVHSGDRLMLVRSTDQSGLERLADSEEIRLSPIDAGPFDSLDEAAALLRAWLEKSWECHALEGGGNSCFEFGGCHRRCWWRGAVGRCELHLEHVIEDGQATAPASPAVAWLRERAAADGDAALAAEGVAPLLLRGWLVSIDADHHFCSLRAHT